MKGTGGTGRKRGKERRFLMTRPKQFRTPGRVFLGGWIVLALLAGPAAGAEKDYPNRIITLINPYAQIGRASCRERV